MSTDADRGRVRVRHKLTKRFVDWFHTHTPGEKRVRIDIHDGLDNYEVIDERGQRLPDWEISYS